MLRVAVGLSVSEIRGRSWGAWAGSFDPEAGYRYLTFKNVTVRPESREKLSAWLEVVLCRSGVLDFNGPAAEPTCRLPLISSASPFHSTPPENGSPAL
ncbi:hypothetical protein N657DRAFT_643687 [Parathielavia appendiculata]|uniref:Uncharacterized protein n=1 Tax=Parathielavia appendiculata TaxID=2587402 RepID=A0AAN6U2F2_9PEZI|nr:hypothetical protein N657DRAFT_643687 [Parathielavia appendiculata]